MKKYLSLVLVALAIITACLCLVACKGDETPVEVVLEELEKVTFKDKAVVYNGKPKNLTVTTRLQYNRLPAGIKVRYEGNGNIEVGDYEVKAIFSKDGVEIPEATKTAKLTIKKAVYDLTESMESFKDTTLPYNGQIQTLKLNEKFLPEGVTVSYDLHGQEPKVAGQYEITAKFTHTNDKNYEAIPDQTVTLTIERKVFDTDGISFNRTFAIFDGSKKSVLVTGTLPEGLQVRYEGNGVISVGKHTVTAVFYTDDPNYEAPASMTTTLEILNEDYSSGDDLEFAYVNKNDPSQGYKITKYTGDADYLILPDTYQGPDDEAPLPVVEIANQVFADQSFVYVYMPDSITKIGSYVFRNCANLRELYLSPKLETIGTGIFRECASLETVTLPDTITAIPNFCFTDCVSLESVKLGSKVESIGHSLFKNCAKLDKIYLPATVQKVTATKATQAPFLGVAENFMIVLESNKKGDSFSEFWTTISSTTEKAALVLYNQTYDSFVKNHAELRNADKTTALAENLILGSTPLMGFDSNKFDYTTIANINYGYPTVSVIAASPAALVTIEQATVANGGKATINIISADGTDNKTYILDFKTIGEFNAKAEIVIKNNADATVTYVIDDGYEPTANFAKSMLLKYNNLAFTFATWTKDFATLTEAVDETDGKKYYVKDNDGNYVYTANQNKVNFWNGILEGVEGRAEITSHTHTHAAWGMNDDGGMYKYVDNSGKLQQKEVPKGSSSKEFFASKQIITDLFPQMKSLGLIEPGIGVQTSDKVVDGETIVTYKHYFTKLLKDSIASNFYLASRSTFHDTSFTNRIVTKETINDLSVRMAIPGLMLYPDVPSAAVNGTYDSPEMWTDFIDEALEKGGWAAYCIHEIGDAHTGRWWISEDGAETLFSYSSSKNIWHATFSDALLYYIEWATATVSSQYNSEENTVTVTLTDEEEANDIFNLALTVKVAVPVMWESATDGTNDLTIHKNADGSKYVFVDVVPDAGAVTLRMGN